MSRRTGPLLCLGLLVNLTLLEGATPANSDQPLEVWLTGRIILEDGSPPLGPVRLVLVCEGRIVQEAVSSAEGLFSLMISVDSNMLQAIVGGSMPQASQNQAQPGSNRLDLSGCSLCLAGGQKSHAEPIRLGPRNSLDDPDVGMIVIRQPARSPGTTVSLDSLRVPESARRFVKEAVEILSRRPSPDYRKAARKLEKAVEIYPRFAVAWQLLGQVRGELRDTAGARRAFEKGLSADPAYAKAHLSLARLDLYEEKWADAAAQAQAALEIHKDSPQALYFKGIAKYYSGQPGDAEEAFVRLKQTGFARFYPVALFHLGVIYLKQAKHAEAVESFELYLKEMPRDKMPKGQYVWIQDQIKTSLATLSHDFPVGAR